MVVGLERGADLHTAQLMPLPLTVFCFSKIQIGFTFLVPAHLGSPGKRAVKRVCVCVCSIELIQCRNDSFDQILQIGSYSKKSRNIQTTVNLLLSSFCDQISTRQNTDIKEFSVYGRHCSRTVNPLHCDSTGKLYTSGVFLQLGLQQLRIYCRFNQ